MCCEFNVLLRCMLQSALSSLEDIKQAVNSGQTVSDRTHRERSCPSQKKQFLLDRHVSCFILQFIAVTSISQTSYIHYGLKSTTVHKSVYDELMIG